MTKNNNRELDFSIVIKISRKIFFKNLGKILLSNQIWPLLLMIFMIGAEFTPFSFKSNDKRFVLSMLLSIPVLTAYPFLHIILSFCYIDETYTHLKKAFSLKYPFAFIYHHVGRPFFLCLTFLFFIGFIISPITALCLIIPYLMYITSLPLMRKVFLSLDDHQSVPLKPLIDKLSSDGKEPVSKQLKIPAIKVFNGIHCFIAIISLCIITWILLEYLHYFELHIFYWSIFSIFFLTYMNYILLVNVVLYRIRVSPYFEDMKSVEDIEDWSEGK